MIDALLQNSEKSLGINRRGDNPDIKILVPVTAIKLAEVEEELKRILANLEVIGITPLQASDGELFCHMTFPTSK